MSETANPSDTVAKQAPTALLALVHHIHENGLGVPQTINAPTVHTPYFGIDVAHFALDAWTERGLVIDDVETYPMPGRTAGTRYERVIVTGRLAALGIRVQISSCRALPRLVAVSAVSA